MQVFKQPLGSLGGVELDESKGMVALILSAKEDLPEKGVSIVVSATAQVSLPVLLNAIAAQSSNTLFKGALATAAGIAGQLPE